VKYNVLVVMKLMLIRVYNWKNVVKYFIKKLD